MKTRDFYPSKWRLAFHYVNIVFDYVWLAIGAPVFVWLVYHNDGSTNLDRLFIFFGINLIALVVRYVLTKTDMNYYLSQYELFYGLSK